MQQVMKCLNVNEKGNLSMGGCDLTDIASEFGTPAYVIDEKTVRENCRAYVNSIKEYYGGFMRAKLCPVSICIGL